LREPLLSHRHRLDKVKRLDHTGSTMRTSTISSTLPGRTLSGSLVLVLSILILPL
jgi:hypothetical protein